MRSLAILLFTLVVFGCQKDPHNTKLSGMIFGTSYGIIYDDETNFQSEIDSLFQVINNSMSTYQLDSDISKLNRNESKEVDEHFITVFDASKRFHEATSGVFDPTIGTLVNAFGFGPEQELARIDSLKIDSLRNYVGLDHVYRAGQFVIKKYPQTYIDFNAIAKGYAVDVVADYLRAQGCKNYLVEIGGEIRSKGMNLVKQAPWAVGIDEPNFDGTQSVLKVIALENNAMATSGTYRKFKLDDQGRRYAHIMDATTGYPSRTNILSVSVLGPNCMMADAYATAFQAMGIDGVKALLKEHPELKVFLIFENDKNEIDTLSLNGFPD